MWKIMAALVLSGLASAPASTDANPPPKWQDEEITVPATVKRDRVRQLRLGKYVALFENTPLEEIRNKIGTGSLKHAGDAAGSASWLCYSLPGQLLWIVSTEMGESEKALMNVFAESIGQADPRRRSCPTIPTALRPVSLQFGWIGTTTIDLEKRFGKPSGIRDDWLLYFYKGKESGPYQGPEDASPHTVDYSVIAYVEARMHKGKVVALRASHVTSY